MSAKPLLATVGLTKTFDGLRVIDGLDFSLDKGELRCLIGPNGAGKSTLFHLISGKLKPTHGEIYFRGERITGLPTHEIARRGIGIKYQIPSVYPDLSVLDNLLIPLQYHRRKNLRRLLYGASDQEAEEALSLLRTLGLYDKRSEPAGSLSHGEMQWLELGMALCGKPVMLLVDEPTAGMSLDETRKTARLLKSLSANLSIVVIEHDLNFIREIARKITVLHAGKVLAEGELAEIEKNEAVQNIYLGR